MPLGTSTAILKVLLIAHAVAAGVLVGALTHLSLNTRKARQGKPNPRLLRLYPQVALGAWAAVTTLGALLYPSYRIRVRAEYLDAALPWASALFDLKENLAALVLPLLFGAWILGRDPDHAARSRGFAGCVYGATATVWFNVVAGLLLTSLRSV